MAEGARIQSVDAVRQFRAALIKYAEVCNTALTSAEGDVDRIMGWLERDQTTFWAGQVRKRHEMVIRCEDAVRQKKLFKGSDGGTQSVVDEMKALQTAKRREEEALHKVEATKKAIQVLRKESQLYKGRVMRLATTVAADIPRAVHRLDRQVEQIEAYLSIQTTGRGLDLAKAIEAMGAGNAGTGPKSLVDRLRARTPTPEQRQVAVFVSPDAGHGLNQPWGVGTVADWQLKALGALSIERSLPEPDHRLVVHPGVWQLPKIYLERRPPTNDGDSGWYIGPAGEADPAPPAPDAPAVAYEMVRVGDVLAVRPDLAALLSLPTEVLAILDPGGPTNVYDAVGVDIWAIALIQAGDDGSDDKAAEAPAEAAAT
jgi:hypothetical protein